LLEIQQSKITTWSNWGTWKSRWS